MKKLRQGTAKVIKGLGILAGVSLLQLLPIWRSYSQSPDVRTLEELYQRRDALIAQIETPATAQQQSLFNNFFANTQAMPDDQLITELRQVEVQILVEQQASDNWRQAISLATQADILANNGESSELSQREEYYLWEQAIENLQEIPPDSFLVTLAAQKIEEYERNVTKVSSALNAGKSNLLEKFAKESGLARNAMITVCNLNRNCVHLRGDQTPASPASLIKVPVAVAVMHKSVEENISLETPILVERINFTEDASPDIQVRKTYPLKTLVDKMLDHSSNIATNQLIDFLSWDYINQFLADYGYETTRVKYKLIGERIRPGKAGSGRNEITTNELTEMMVQIYNYEHPHSQVLIDALNQQYDRVIGYAAVEEMEGVTWLGEKTGQNSRVLGSTTAVDIWGEIYVITVIHNRGGGDLALRNCIHKIVDHISQSGNI